MKDPVLGENKSHTYKPVCESHDEYCAICLKDENDPIHKQSIYSFDVPFVDFCLEKTKEYHKKCEELEKKHKLWFLNKEWRTMWFRWGYYLEQAQREVNQSNKGEIK